MHELSMNKSDDGGETACFKIETEIRVTTKNGMITYEHDPIELNGIQMVLVPASSFCSIEHSPNGKLCSLIVE